jgi:hypothetical protein
MLTQHDDSGRCLAELRANDTSCSLHRTFLRGTIQTLCRIVSRTPGLQPRREKD